MALPINIEDPLNNRKAWGRGYKKIREGFESVGLPMPKIEEVDGGVKVIFQRRNVNNGETTQKTTQKATQKTTQKIVELMKQNPIISTEAIAEICGLTRDGVNYHIRKLKAKGIIRRVDGRKAGHWEVMIDSRIGSD
jgi:ATP-dependent DNA helicase RecG